MFVLTVDQIDSRESEVDDVAPILADRDAWRSAGALLGPDRTAGDEFQVVYESAPAALDAALRLRRTGAWSVGIGVGDVRTPLPDTTGAGRGTRSSPRGRRSTPRSARSTTSPSPHRTTAGAAACPR